MLSSLQNLWMWFTGLPPWAQGLVVAYLAIGVLCAAFCWMLALSQEQAFFPDVSPLPVPRPKLSWLLLVWNVIATILIMLFWLPGILILVTFILVDQRRMPKGELAGRKV